MEPRAVTSKNRPQFYCEAFIGQYYDKNYGFTDKEDADLYGESGMSFYGRSESLRGKDNDYLWWDFNRMNLDWRFGVRASYKRLSLGLAYTVGLTNRIEESDGKISMKQNSFQLSLGWTF